MYNVDLDSKSTGGDLGSGNIRLTEGRVAINPRQFRGLRVVFFMSRRILSSVHIRLAGDSSRTFASTLANSTMNGVSFSTSYSVMVRRSEYKTGAKTAYCSIASIVFSHTWVCKGQSRDHQTFEGKGLKENKYDKTY